MSIAYKIVKEFLSQFEFRNKMSPMRYGFSQKPFTKIFVKISFNVITEKVIFSFHGQGIAKNSTNPRSIHCLSNKGTKKKIRHIKIQTI